MESRSSERVNRLPGNEVSVVNSSEFRAVLPARVLEFHHTLRISCGLTHRREAWRPFFDISLRKMSCGGNV